MMIKIARAFEIRTHKRILEFTTIRSSYFDLLSEDLPREYFTELFIRMSYLPAVTSVLELVRKNFLHNFLN
jgi:hypothetical protein